VPDHPRHPDDLAPLSDLELVADAQRLYPLAGAERETAKRCVGVVLLRHRDMVRAVVAAKVPREHVDEVESSVFMRFSRKVFIGDQITNPVGLLLRMAQFERASFHERRGEPEASLGEWDGPTPDPALDGPAVDAGVEELLAPLNGRQREVVWQRIVEGRSSAEVANEHGTTPGNVDVIVHRALAKMREAAT
jgi:DNA-directed RNA polymerase specialized sigma24 family protein